MLIHTPQDTSSHRGAAIARVACHSAQPQSSPTSRRRVPSVVLGLVLLLLLHGTRNSPLKNGCALCPICVDEPTACTSTTIDLSNHQPPLVAINSSWFNHTDCSTYTVLNLDTNAINTTRNPIEPGTFDHMTSLGVLTLFSNLIYSFPAGIFDQLTNLGNLDLHYNKLTSLPVGVFDQMVSLNTLNLDDNKLTSLRAGVFDQCTGLTDLSLQTNLFDKNDSLPVGVFSQLANLATLRLYNSRLDNLTVGTFDGLTSLTRLELQNNGLTDIVPGLFNQLNALTYLDLSLNGPELTSLRVGVFDGLTSLTDLNLEANTGLTSLPAGIFNQLYSLESLKVRGQTRLTAMSLSSLPAGLFDNMASLTLLNLENNLLTSLPPGIFDQLGNLVELTFAGNSITALPVGIFDQLTNVTFLRFGYNPITSLPENIFDNLVSLEVLNLLYLDHVTTLPARSFDQLATYGNLRLLWLDGSNMTALPGTIFTWLTPSGSYRLNYSPYVCSNHPSAVYVPVGAATASFVCAGLNRTVQQDFCAYALCANGGSCTNLPGSFSCACSPGWTGSNCSTETNECSSSPCQNGGTCIDAFSSFSCLCPVPFSETDACVSCASGYASSGSDCIEITPLPWVDPVIGTALGVALLLAGMVGRRSMRRSHGVLDRVAGGTGTLFEMKMMSGSTCASFGRLFVAWLGVWFAFIQFNAFSFVRNFEWNTDISPQVPVRRLGLEVDSLPELQLWFATGIFASCGLFASLFQMCGHVTLADGLADVLGTVLYIPALRVAFSILACLYQQPHPVLLKDKDVECWAGRHQWLSAVAGTFLVALLLFGSLYTLRIRPYRVRAVRGTASFELILLICKIWLAGVTTMLRFHPWPVVLAVFVTVCGLLAYVSMAQPFLGTSSQISNRVHAMIFTVATSSAFFAGVSLAVSDPSNAMPTYAYFASTPLFVLIVDRLTRKRRKEAEEKHRKEEVDDIGILLYSMKSDDPSRERTMSYVNQYCSIKGIQLSDIEEASSTAARFTGRVTEDLKLAHGAERTLAKSHLKKMSLLVRLIAAYDADGEKKTSDMLRVELGGGSKEGSLEIVWIPKSLSQMNHAVNQLLSSLLLVIDVRGASSDSSRRGGEWQDDLDTPLWRKARLIWRDPMFSGVLVLLYILGGDEACVKSWNSRMQMSIDDAEAGGPAGVHVMGDRASVGDQLHELAGMAKIRMVDRLRAFTE